jgi:RNA polymerase sigma-70 factor (ECF subfamily)
MMGESFDSVLAAARLGADWAWRVLYEDTAPGLRAYLSFRGAYDPDGLVGDVFLAAAKGIGSFEGSEEGFRSWLFSIAHARLVDERRMRARRRTDPADSSELVGIPDRSDVETVALARFSSDRIAELFSMLSPDQRDVLTLRIIADLSLEETASILGKRVGAVKVLQHRGLSRLRKLAKEGVTL